MMDMVRDGGRGCQGTSGLFTTQDKSVTGALICQNDEQAEVADAWRVREREQAEITAGGQLELDVPHALDCDQLRLRSKQYGSRGGQQSKEMDELAEMLQDARVGLESGDFGMDELMAGVEGLAT